MRPSESPEFRQILRDLVDEGYEGGRSGQLLHEAWKRYKATYGSKRGLRRGKCKTCGKLFAPGETKHHHGNPRKAKQTKRCKQCGGIVKGSHCLNCFKKNPPLRDEAYHGYLIRSNHVGEIWIEKDTKLIGWAKSLADAKRIIDELTRKNPIAIYNPPNGKLLPMAVKEIRYKRTSGKYGGELFKHHFKTNPKVFGLPDGSILIKSNERLWGTA